MPFALHCTCCNALLKAPDEAAGRTLSCPRCQTRVTFPRSLPPRRPPAEELPPIAEAPPPAAEESAPPAPAPSPAPASPAPTTPPPASAPPPEPAASGSILGDLDLDAMPPLEGDPPPAAQPPARPKSPPAAVPNLSLDDPPAPEPAVPRLELDAEIPFAVPEPEALDEIELVEEELEEVLPVEDAEELEVLDELEEVPPQASGPPLPLEDSVLLQLRQVLLREPKAPADAAHELLDPETRRRVAVAREAARRPGGEGRVEIREGGDLLATVRPTDAYFDQDMVEVTDADGRVLGLFDDRPLARLFKKPLEIVDRRGRPLLELCVGGGARPRLEFLDADETPLGDLVAADGSGEFRGELARGRGCQLNFRAALDDRPEDKLCLLAAVIALDLFDRAD